MSADLIPFPKTCEPVPPSGPPRPETVLHDIRVLIQKHHPSDGMTPQHHRQLDRQRGVFSQFAAAHFGALNGWKCGREFCLGDIGRRHLRNLRLHSNLEIFDHIIGLKRGHLCAALVTQPYNDDPDTARALAALHGLTLHVPPVPLASIHFPGATAFFVFTEPGHAIRWLPEQISGLEGEV